MGKTDLLNYLNQKIVWLLFSFVCLFWLRISKSLFVASLNVPLNAKNNHFKWHVILFRCKFQMNLPGIYTIQQSGRAVESPYEPRFYHFREWEKKEKRTCTVVKWTKGISLQNIYSKIKSEENDQSNGRSEAKRTPQNYTKILVHVHAFTHTRQQIRTH